VRRDLGAAGRPHAIGQTAPLAAGAGGVLGCASPSVSQAGRVCEHLRVPESEGIIVILNGRDGRRCAPPAAAKKTRRRDVDVHTPLGSPPERRRPRPGVACGRGLPVARGHLVKWLRSTTPLTKTGRFRVRLFKFGRQSHYADQCAAPAAASAPHGTVDACIGPVGRAYSAIVEHVRRTTRVAARLYAFPCPHGLHSSRHHGYCRLPPTSGG
jgi:hypothetical protein